jgi:hypothetical protein
LDRPHVCSELVEARAAFFDVMPFAMIELDFLFRGVS